MRDPLFPFRRRPARIGATLALALVPATVAAAAADLDEMTSMNLEDLMKVEVSSASRKQQKMADVAAAMYVISQEDIRRSGATSIPEALRLAPGLHVARIGSSSWAISARGFNDRYANKLLVLIDGRTVYTPMFSGVFWDIQDTFMDDIERIEVIRGPGAAMWGANAVNGVINIITKSARDTQGNLAVAGVGSEERGLAGFRHGGRTDDDTHYRVYAKGFERNAAEDRDGTRLHDDWRGAQTGFRMDKRLGDGNRLTVSGDAYQARVGETVRPYTILTPPYSDAFAVDDRASGMNLLTRWESRLADQSEIQVQAYFDRVRFAAPKLGDTQHTFDVDFQHRLAPSLMHDIMWGANVRHIRSRTEPSADITFAHESLAYTNFSVFVQDDMALIPERLRLTLGTKFEKAHFGGSQFQPNARLLWTPDGSHSVWAAASRASRTPSRGEADAYVALGVVPPFTGDNATPLPMQVATAPNADLRAEKLTAYEIGYRTLVTPRLSLDVTAFSNRYARLSQWTVGAPTLSLAPVPNLHLPLTYENGTVATKTRGFEVVADWRATDRMRLEGSWTLLRYSAPRPDGVNIDYAGTSPRHQYSLRWQTDLTAATQFDVWIRRVGKLIAQSREIPAYTALDLRLGHAVSKKLDISLIGQNLLDRRHPEFAESTSIPAAYLARGVFVKASWKP